MENPGKQTASYETYGFEFASDTTINADVETRLNAVLARRDRIDGEHAPYRTEHERLQASLIKNPITTETAYSYLGLLLGFLPPFTLFSKFIYETIDSTDAFLVPLLLFTNFVCAVVGYFSGKLIGRMVAETEKWSWTLMLLASPFIGSFWGLMSGAAGGVFLFVFGAIFGAVIGALVGAAALPVFTVFHRLLKKGDVIERNQFLPIAIGISLSISAFLLGITTF